MASITITKKDYEYLHKGIKHCVMTSDTSYFIAYENEDFKEIRETYGKEFVYNICVKSLEYHQIFVIAKICLEFDLYSENASKFADCLTHRVFNDLNIFLPSNLQ